jgi:hypothetical protein
MSKFKKQISKLCRQFNTYHDYHDYHESSNGSHNLFNKKNSAMDRITKITDEDLKTYVIPYIVNGIKIDKKFSESKGLST